MNDRAQHRIGAIADWGKSLVCVGIYAINIRYKKKADDELSMKKLKKYTGLIAWFIFAVAVIAVYKTFDNFRDITKIFGLIFKALQPFVVAFVIAYVLNLPAEKIRGLLERLKWKWVQKHKLGLSIGIVYILFALVLTLIISALVPALYRNLIEFYLHLPEYLAGIENAVNSMQIFDRFRDIIGGELNIIEVIGDMLRSLDITQFAQYAQGVIHVTSGVVSFLVSIIISVYMLLDEELIWNYVKRLIRVFFKDKNTEGLFVYTARINRIFTNYIYSRLMCCVIMAVICVIALLLMDVKYALVLGLFIGVCDLIPYFGSIVGTAIAIGVAALTGSGLWGTVWIGVVLIVLQQIDGNIIAPKIMGDTLEIRPLLVIFAVVTGGSLFGVIGMLISVPVITVIKTIICDLVEDKEAREMAEERGDAGDGQ